MDRVVIVTNIPSPYRVDLFYYMQKYIREYEFHIIYTSIREDNRNWAFQKEKMINSHIMKSKVLKLKGKWDYRYLHIPGNIASLLKK